MENKAVNPDGLGYGFLFFRGEARSAKQLRLQLVEADTHKVHVLQLKF